MVNDGTKRHQADLDLFGRLVNDLGKEEEGGVRHASLESFKWNLSDNCDLNRYDT